MGEATKVQQRDERNVEKKEVDRLRTNLDSIGRKAMITALATVGGLSIGVASSNIVLGSAGSIAISAALRMSPIGKQVIYFKKEKS